MDITPTTSSLNDSGYNSSSSRSSNVKRILHFPTFESTPSSSRLRSRKRKSDDRYRKLSDILEERQGLPVSPNCSFYDNCFSQNSIDYSKSHSQSGISFFRNSFDDAKLSSTLEKCSLDEYHSPIKKYKWNEGRKSSSAPGTPQRQENQDSDNSLRKFCSLDLTPTKGTNVKIGTPERLEILYPNIRLVKSPEKIRSEIKRLRKPSNKRFQFHCRDFVHIFTHVEKVDHIIKQIFSYLPDTDLVNVAKVSKLWKKTLYSDDEAYRRYKTHLKNIIIRKENIYDTVIVKSAAKKWRNLALPAAEQIGGTVSPSRVNWATFATIGAALNESQRLTKCLVCARPAVVERGLARCSFKNCEYLWCVGCYVGAQTPEDLDCRCQSPHSPPSPLQDKSNIGSSSTSAVVSFLSNSGYYSDEKSSKSHVLMDCNENFTQQKIPTLNSNTSGFDILEHRDKIHKAKKTLSNRRNRASGSVPEPGSPPNVKMSAAGSRQSKRNLKRLLF